MNMKNLHLPTLLVMAIFVVIAIMLYHAIAGRK